MWFYINARSYKYTTTPCYHAIHNIYNIVLCKSKLNLKKQLKCNFILEGIFEMEISSPFFLSIEVPIIRLLLEENMNWWVNRIKKKILI